MTCNIHFKISEQYSITVVKLRWWHSNLTWIISLPLINFRFTLLLQGTSVFTNMHLAHSYYKMKAEYSYSLKSYLIVFSLFIYMHQCNSVNFLLRPEHLELMKSLEEKNLEELRKIQSQYNSIYICNVSVLKFDQYFLFPLVELSNIKER